MSVSVPHLPTQERLPTRTRRWKPCFAKAGIVRCFSREELTTVASIFTLKEVKGKKLCDYHACRRSGSNVGGCTGKGTAERS